ncbi:MAG: MBL fold metallo-hydrolase [Bacteroidota bacterium]
MKNKLLFVVSLCISSIAFTYGQNQGPWFTAKEVGPKIWQISDHGSDNIYLVEGKKKAMLIDNGLGSADLVSFVNTLSTKPLTVVITHGHPDHAGSNYQFEEVYIHPADADAARALNNPGARAGSAKMMQGGNAPAENEIFKGKAYDTKLLPVKHGQVFNLGGRKMEVMETPGHTPGGISVLDVKNKILFSGDNNNSLVWLFLQNCLPLSEYLVTLEKQKSRLSEFTTLMPGHGPPMPSDFINDQIECVKGILNGTLERKEYKSFAGNALISTWGKSSVTFNPDNL